MARALAIAVLAASLCAAACSPYREVRNVAQLGGNAKRVVIVEVVPEGTSVSGQFGGIYLGSNLVVDDQIPMNGGQPDFDANSGHEVDSKGFGANGGIVPIGTPAGPLYILGIRAESTHLVWSTTFFLPMVVRIPPAVSTCEYVGTIHLWGPSRFELRDEFEQSRSRLAATVAGCDLTRNIGARALR